MPPVEPRLKPLCATFIHYMDGNKGKDACKGPKLIRCHSFSGYVPYHLEQEEPENAESIPSNCSSGSTETPETDIGEEGDPAAQAWPDTDDEWGSESSKSAPTVAMVAMYVPQVEEKVIEGLCRAATEAALGAPGPSGRSASVFNYIGDPPDINSFVWQLCRNYCCDTRTFVFAFAYLCRISETNRGKVDVSKQTIHRLLLAAVTVAAKHRQLYTNDNGIYAQAGNVSTTDLNQLEACFLELLKWNLDVSPKTFKRIYRLLCRAAA